VALALCLGVLACGPSFQTVYEGDVRFEHCYALDGTSAPIEAKKECWRRWLHDYTNGQSMDRVEYAATRFSQLSLGPTLPSEESQEARPRRRTSTVAAPVPTSAFAPPPNLASSAPATATLAPNAAAREGGVRAPASECSDGCAEHWSACHGTCQGTACDACDTTYRSCVPACFREDSVAPAQSAPASLPPRGAK
jgi:hypothetical protein